MLEHRVAPLFTEIHPDDADALTGARLTVDLDALAANYRALRNSAAGARTAAVVKADGYGLGAGPVAEACAREGCDLFFVAHPVEGIALRRHGGALARAQIAVLNGLTPGAEAALIEHRLIPVLNTFAEIETWLAEAEARRETLPCFIQVDSGMSRLGLDEAGLSALSARPEIFERLDVKAVMSHLACADDPSHAQNALQLKRFEAALARLPGVPASLSNSAATLGLPEARYDIVRPGIALYGGNPFAAGKTPMKPVVGLEARVLQIRALAEGESVGYGATWTAKAPARVATISLGYADGFFRLLSSKAAAFAAGHKLPLAGRVSMDSVSLDITAVPEAALREGDWVEILGPHQSIDDLAKRAKTIGYEVLTNLGTRFHRVYRREA